MCASLRRVPASADALAEAQRRGAFPHLVGPVRGKAEALDAIGAALDFPSWYGRNLDALYDCLTDLSWQPPGEQVLIWTGHHQLEAADPDAYRAVLAVLADAVSARNRQGRPLTVVLADQ